MRCPACGFENLEGADFCEECMMPLVDLDPPAQTPLESSLVEEPVRSLGPKDAITVTPETSIADTVQTLVDNNIGCVLVSDQGGKPVGIFSERDLLLKIAHDYEAAALAPVSRYMTPHPETLDQGSSIAFALNRMSLGDFRHLPLTSDRELVGIISLRDFLAHVHKWHPEIVPNDQLES